LNCTLDQVKFSQGGELLLGIVGFGLQNEKTASPLGNGQLSIDDKTGFSINLGPMKFTNETTRSYSVKSVNNLQKTSKVTTTYNRIVSF